MTSIAAKISSFLGRVVTADVHDSWWEDLSPEAQQEYLSKHPGSHLKKAAKTKAGPATNKAAPPIPQAPVDDEAKPASEKVKENRSGHLQPAPEDREQWPEHIKALKLPPAWTHLKISHDPHADLLAIGKDSKSRDQYVYSEKFSSSQSAVKFARISELDSKFHYISDQNAQDRKSKNDKTRDHADCMHLIMTMGLRPGGDEDTGAEKKAYGATTLEGRHVVKNKDGTVSLKFVGKKGVDLDLPVDDPDAAKLLLKRSKMAGPDGKLFPTVKAGSLLDYVHGYDGGGFKIKDFRTLLGTRLAHKMVGDSETPVGKTQYQKAARAIAKAVSIKLGNTPAVALTSYINPLVFAPWSIDTHGEHPMAEAETASDNRHGNLPGIRFGRKQASSIDWRKVPLHGYHIDDDRQVKPSPDVIRILGFDPTKLLTGRK